jgi:lipopolysaccharide assembly protein A
MGRLIGAIVFVLLVLVGLALASANDTPVRINFFFGSIELAVSQALTLALTCGAVLGVAVCLPLLLRARFETRRLRRKGGNEPTKDMR